MKIQVVKTISAGLMLAALSACSFGGDSTADQNKNYLDDRSRILSQYQPVIGTYEGQITAKIRDAEDLNKFDTKLIKVLLEIYTQDVHGVKDANGQSTPLPTLVIRYRQLDVVRPDELMEARYIQESGKLTASNSTSNSSGSNNTNNGSSSSGGNNTAVSICSSAGTIATALGDDTQVIGNTITGSILRNNGVLGKFTATLVSHDVVAPATDPVSDCNDRLADEYKAFSGMYTGTIIHTPENGGSTTPFSLSLNYVPMVTSNGLLASTLQGSVTYQGEIGLTPLTFGPMPAVFRAESIPAQLAMSYYVASTGGGFTMSGTLENGTFVGEAYSSNTGHLGHVVVKKSSQLK
jgi:hypothetical protein